ncbi:MAG: WG repeat-containing protein [Paludibacteraceae bacterium]|nr:WG repeat-containing protein [Paludibacteraceae bacterium]
MKNIGAIILLMMSCWASSQAISKKQLEQLNMNVSGYTIYPFAGEFAPVKNAVGRYGLIDRKGDFAYPVMFDTITFSSDYINLIKNGKSILLNSKGEFLLDSTQYASIVLEDNFARVVNKAGKHGCYGKNFQMVLPNNYDESDYVFYGMPNSECMFALKNAEGKWAIRSSKNGQETEYIYDKAPVQIQDQYLKVYRQALYSVFDGSTFRDILPYREYIDSCSFWNNDVNFFVAMDKSDSLSYIYNSDGKKVAQKPSTEFCYWKNKYVVVSKGAEGRNIPLKMLNKNGKEVHILKVTDDLCWQYKNNKWTFKSTSGKRLAGPFDEFAFLDQGKEESLFIVGNDGKYGLVNMKGKTVIPLEYAAVQFHHSGHVKVFIEYDPADVNHTKDKFKFYTSGGKQLKGEVLTFDPFVDSCASKKQEQESLDYMWFRNTEGKYGLCRMKDMKVLVPFVCEECGSLMTDGMAVAIYEGRRYYINEKGEGLPAEVYKKK